MNSVLRNRNFVLLWCAYAISVLGDHLSELAILKMQGGLNTNVDITPFQARIMFLFMLPFFIFGPFMGALSDRFSRKWIMITADIVRALIMFCFYWIIRQFSGFYGWGPFVPFFFIGFFAAMFSPARLALLPIVVKPGQLIKANSLISALGIIVSMCSVMLSGYLAEHYAPTVSFRIDGITFIVSAILLFCIHLTYKSYNQKSGDTQNIKEKREHHTSISYKSFIDGFRYVFSHKKVMQLLLLAMLFWMCGSAIRSIIPAIVKDVYNGSFQQIGLFQAWLGLGLFSGAILINLLGTILRSEVAIPFGFLGAGLSVLILFASIAFDFTPFTAHITGASAIFSVGFSGVAITIGYNSLFQRIVPDRLRGRVFGILNLCTVFGLLLATGILAIPEWKHLDRWIAEITLLISIIFILTGAIVLLLYLKRSPHRWLLALMLILNELHCKIWYRLKITGLCTVPPSGPIILVANHLSAIDPALLCASIKNRLPSFIMAEEYTNILFLRKFVRLLECIPVKRNSNDINATKEAIKRLRAGKIVTIFIQGGIALEDQVQELKNGAALLAMRTGAQIIPAQISGTVHRNSIIADIIFRHKANVRFGQPIDLKNFRLDRKRKDLLTDITNEIFTKIVDLNRGIDPATE